MRALDLIIKKRGAMSLSKEEIQFLIEGYVAGNIPDYQISAMLMAIFLQGMNEKEVSYLTQAMIDSGDCIDLSSLSGYSTKCLVDKHSTGGVGDKVSLILAPIVATVGAQIPMISGRGLGHTGGTLDKLESIPGYRTDISPERFVEIIAESGFAMSGQSERIVPADKKLYALRDVTATVESIPLITASILSKKFAEGAQHLVFDVKYGSGAFMKKPEEAEALARSLVRVGKELGRGVSALITNMDVPLGSKIGNFLEVEETIACLEGRGWSANFDLDNSVSNPFNENFHLSLTGESSDLMEITLYLSAEMLRVSGLVPSISDGITRSLEVLHNGSALERFWQNVALQGGKRQECKAQIGRRNGLFSKTIMASQSGYLAELDAYKLGLASVLLGAGRSLASDSVLSDVGIEVHAKPGDQLDSGDAICTLYAQSKHKLSEAENYLKGIQAIEQHPRPKVPILHSVISD